MRTPSLSAPGIRRQRAFSFVEMMVASAVFALVISAIVWTNLVGMTMMDFTRPKLEAQTQCQQLLSRLMEDITSAKIVRICQYGGSVPPPEIPDGSDKKGNALLLQPGTDTNEFICYYRDGADQALKLTTSAVAPATIIAPAVINDLVFSFESATNLIAGNVLITNRQNFVVVVDLQFSQIGASGTPVGPGNYFHSYQFRTHVARRTQ